jgi:hypothetical protein
MNTMTKSFHWLASIIAAALLLRNDGPRVVVVVHAFSTSSTTTTVHLIDNIPCREIGIYVSSLDESITILEATLEGQDKLVDEVLMLDE